MKDKWFIELCLLCAHTSSVKVFMQYISKNSHFCKIIIRQCISGPCTSKQNRKLWNQRYSWPMVRNDFTLELWLESPTITTFYWKTRLRLSWTELLPESSFFKILILFVFSLLLNFCSKIKQWTLSSLSKFFLPFLTYLSQIFPFQKVLRNMQFL